MKKLLTFGCSYTDDKYIELTSKYKQIIDLLKDKLSCIFYLIDKYKQKNDPQLLTFVSLLIELFYNDLSIKNNKNLGLYFVNKFKLLKQIDHARKFNLDKKNLLISIKGMLEHESK